MKIVWIPTSHKDYVNGYKIVLHKANPYRWGGKLYLKVILDITHPGKRLFPFYHNDLWNLQETIFTSGDD